MESPDSALATFPAYSANGLEATLVELLSESVSSVKRREKNELNRLLQNWAGQCVLFGAGNMGRRALAALQSIGALPLCISDNNPEIWGIKISDTLVLPPEEAVEQFGASAHFFISIRNEHHWYRETADRLVELGCASISSAEPIAWHFPEQFPPFLPYDLPSNVYQQADQVLRSSRVWADDGSRMEYLAQIRLRAVGDAYGLSAPMEKESYILDEVFAIQADDIILDCGAFDGDTIRNLIEDGTAFARIEAVEADSHSFARLADYIASLEPTLHNKVRLHQCAIGSQKGKVHFEDTGGVNSKVSAQGKFIVDMVPIDVMFASKHVSMIKMDIEGGEYEALLGAANVIRRDRPILAICAYHSQEDIWRLPLLIRDICSDYNMYLRSYCGDGIQTVVYAVPPERVSKNAKV